MATPLTIYNTMSRKKEIFEPIKPPHVGFYSCGPTVYNYAHIGNLRTYIFTDILKRTLLMNNFDVNHVMNITDVGHLTDDADAGEDKMEKGAQREGKSVWEIAEEYTAAFMSDMMKLNILQPTTWCKATDHIQEQIDQVKAIEEAGFTYTTSDAIYFDTSKLEDYGKLARLKLDELQEGARVDMGDKKNKSDFALWKFSPTNEKRAMEWESPWGTGFPGWHIECSTMSSKYLGEQFDLHTGGIDHIPVHHTNEIAQAETAFKKKPWVKYWMHGQFLVLEKEKMAKSGENFITLATVEEKGFDPLDYRYLCLTAHYQQQLKFSWEAMETAKQSRQRLMNIVEELQEEVKDENPACPGCLERFKDAINDDLNVPQALAVLWECLRNKEVSAAVKVATAKEFDKVLGLKLLEQEAEEIPDEIIELAEAREKARASQDWATSDKLRDEIKEKGYLINDSKDGFKIKKV